MIAAFAVIVVALYLLLRRGDKTVDDVKKMVDEQGNEAAPEAIEFVEKNTGSSRFFQWFAFVCLCLVLIVLFANSGVGALFGMPK